jgi:hypothetical protein
MGIESSKDRITNALLYFFLFICDCKGRIAIGSELYCQSISTVEEWVTNKLKGLDHDNDNDNNDNNIMCIITNTQ